MYQPELHFLVYTCIHTEHKTPIIEKKQCRNKIKPPPPTAPYTHKTLSSTSSHAVQNRRDTKQERKQRSRKFSKRTERLMVRPRELNQIGFFQNI